MAKQQQQAWGGVSGAEPIIKKDQKKKIKHDLWHRFSFS